MKALSLWQPWASLVAFGEKKVETRCWTTKYRGPIAIASTRTIPRWLGESRKSQDFHDALVTTMYERGIETLVRGSVLCVAELVDIQETSVVRDDLSQREQLFGNYEDGRYAWFLENIRRLKVPISVKGNRLLWNWEPPNLEFIS